MQLPFREWTLFCGISLGGGRNASARSGIPERLDKLEISDSVKKVSFCYSVGECSGFARRVLLCSLEHFRRKRAVAQGWEVILWNFFVRVDRRPQRGMEGKRNNSALDL